MWFVLVTNYCLYCQLAMSYMAKGLDTVGDFFQGLQILRMDLKRKLEETIFTNLHW